MEPFGSTRSRVCDNHALICPDSFVTAPLPGWRETKGVVLVSPRMGAGAGFVMYLAHLEPGSSSKRAAAGIERVVYVVEGQAIVDFKGASEGLGTGGYAYFPPGSKETIHAEGKGRLCVFEKRYVRLPGVEPPKSFVAPGNFLVGEPFLGDPDARLAVLLPDQPRFDLAVNVFTYQSGATLPMVEVHVMEHGLLMLEGQGIYRLGDSWYPVREGDAIWMGPYCPQWFVAMGKGPARYLYYKDVNRDALTAGSDG
jgi:(S)-ureidoglycine aminohydrolase